MKFLIPAEPRRTDGQNTRQLKVPINTPTSKIFICLIPVFLWRLFSFSARPQELVPLQA